jgi:hypothetical protein
MCKCTKFGEVKRRKHQQDAGWIIDITQDKFISKRKKFDWAIKTQSTLSLLAATQSFADLKMVQDLSFKN